MIAQGMSEDDAHIVSDNLSESTAKLTSAIRYELLACFLKTLSLLCYLNTVPCQS